MAIILVLAGLVGGIFGLINVIKPLGVLKITRRIHAVIVLGASFWAFVFGGILGAVSQPGGLPAPDTVSAATPATVKAAEEPRPARVAEPGISEAEFIAIWSRVKAAMEPCDSQVSRAGDAMQTGNAYASYPLVLRAKEACWVASQSIKDVAIPRSARGDARKAIIEARDRCSLAMFVKRQAMDKVAKVVDGDARPSAVASAQSEMEDANRMTMGCVVGFMSAAEAAGHVLPEFREVMAEAEKAG